MFYPFRFQLVVVHYFSIYFFTGVLFLFRCLSFLLFSIFDVAVLLTVTVVASGAWLCVDLMDSAHYLVQTYMSLRAEWLYFDAIGAQSMRYMDAEWFYNDEQFWEGRLTSLGFWERRWKHCGAKGAIGSQDVWWCTDSPIMCCL